jgi:hypothetical protein
VVAAISFLSYLGDGEADGDEVRAALAGDGLGLGDGVGGLAAACCVFTQASKSDWLIAWTMICIWL